MPEYSDDEKDELVRKVCSEITDGGMVADACKKLGISRVSLFRWSESSDELRNLYARAREAQAHALAEECLTLADSATAETWQQTRLRVDTRKWYVSKIAPKLYGDKLELSSDPDRPLVVKFQRESRKTTAG